MPGDINAYNPIWNSYCHKRQNATILEKLIKQFRVLINNKPGRITHPIGREVSIIDLV